MDDIGLIPIWLLLLFLLGCALAVIVAVGAAVAHGRLALAAVIGGGSFLFVIVAAVLVAMFFVQAAQPHASVGGSEPSVFKSDVESSSPAHFQWTGLPQVVASSHNTTASIWHISVTHTVLLIGLVLFLFARFGKHHFAHATAGHARAWPIVLVIVLIVFLMSRGVRYQVETKRAAEESNQMVAEQSVEINAKFRQQAEALAKQQQDLAKRVAELTKNIQQRIDKTDIHQLMDEFDAPRIVLHAPFASMPSPAALLVAAAPSAFNSFQKSTMAEADETAVHSIEHDQVKSKKNSRSKPTAVASAKKNESPPAAPSTPATPSAPAPAATPPVAATPATFPEPFAAEDSSGNDIDLGKPEATPPRAWKIQPHAAGKPAWINNPPKRTGDVRREVIATEEYATADDCYRAADINLMLKAYDRLQELEGNPYPFPEFSDSELPISFNGKKIMWGGQTLWDGTNWSDYRLLLLSAMGIDPDFLRREIVAKDPKNNESCEYIESVTRSVGPMKKLYVQIEFTPAVDRVLTQRWDAFHRRKSFVHVGIGAFLIFSLLSIAWGLLKIDTATKGYYTKWLLVGGPVAIIGVTTLSLFVWLGLRW